MNRIKLISLHANADKTLSLEYANGEKKCFDVKPYIKGSWYGELDDDIYFQTVRIIHDGRGIEWLHGQDIAPHELYEFSTLAL